MNLRVFFSIAVFCAWALAPYGASAQQSDAVIFSVSPRDADPAITRFVDDDVVLSKRTVRADAPLLVFLPGTHGVPQNVKRFLAAAALDGYRAIGLMYDDADAVNVICPQNPDPSCTALVRRKRIYGVNDTKLIDDQPQESIVNRLVKLLQYLDAQRPAEGWKAYLAGAQPNWSRIAVSGHSQGAGMAAFIAKEHAVARVILFSSPWDFQRGGALSPWLREPSATPPDRWFAAYHTKEPMARFIARAYLALGIPSANVRVLSLEPQPNANVARLGRMVYHTSVVGDYTTPLNSDGTPAYSADWLFMLGHP